MTRLTAPFLMGALLLAGCGGSGGGDDCVTGEFCDINSSLVDTLTEAGLESTNDVNRTLGDTATESPTSIDDLPISGDVNYAGQMFLQVRENGAVGDVLLGNLELTVGFTDTGGSFTGTASSFVGETTGQYTGELELTDGNLVQGGAAFQTTVAAAITQGPLAVASTPPDIEDMVGLISDVSGELTSATEAETSFDGTFVGSFSGENADVVGLAVGATQSDVAPGEFIGILVAVE